MVFGNEMLHLPVPCDLLQECYAMAHSAYDVTPGMEFSTTATNGYGMIAAAPAGIDAGGMENQYNRAPIAPPNNGPYIVPAVAEKVS